MDISVASWIWIGLIILFTVVEGATVGLVSIWFATGGVAALIASVITDSLAVQLAVFLIVSFLALALTRPLVKKQRLDKVVPTNANMNVGRKAVVIAAVTPDLPGRVRLDGVDWSARCTQPLAEGTLCIVETVEGATLTVRPEAAAGTAGATKQV